MSRKQIWLNPPLERLVGKCGEAKGRDGQFSRRLGDIVERYESIIANTPIPEITDNEKMVLGEAVSGGTLSSLKIKYLHESIADIGASGAVELSKKVEKWTTAERIAVIESLGI